YERAQGVRFPTPDTKNAAPKKGDGSSRYHLRARARHHARLSACHHRCGPVPGATDQRFSRVMRDRSGNSSAALSAGFHHCLLAGWGREGNATGVSGVVAPIMQ
ncbi:MAG: hypothetical protein LC793_23950, partial [Thermomicrobia bacterium]|nr:hypothetical protein [Thermomicrobia bacterium]